MIIMHSVAIPLFAWAILFALHNLLLTFNVSAYRKWLTLDGIRINWFSVRVFITRFNLMFMRIASIRPKLTKRWFSIGCFVTILSMPISFVLILWTFWGLLKPFLQSWFSFSDEYMPGSGGSSNVLQPVIPGINLPLNDFVYYIIALIFASGFHELGHALAAARESVKIHGFGFLLCLFIPTAFVEISTDQLLKVSIWKRLKIISAGIWHNYVLGCFCAFLLLINPLLLSPFYQLNQGAVVSHVDKESGVFGPYGLRVGDVIRYVNGDCIVHNREDFKMCLKALIFKPLTGYCVSNSFIEKEQYHSLIPGQCCGDESKSNLCFDHFDSSNSQICIPVRLMLSTKPDHCNHTNDCSQQKQLDAFQKRYSLVSNNEEIRVKNAGRAEELHRTSSSTYRTLKAEHTSQAADELKCIRPQVYAQGVRLIELQRENNFRFLFYGFPSELFQAISVIDYHPKFRWLPITLVYHYESLLKYIISFSFGLAVINLVPCYFLDGQWLIQFLVDFLLRSRVQQKFRAGLITFFTLFGTFSLCACLFLSFYNLISVTLS